MQWLYNGVVYFTNMFLTLDCLPGYNIPWTLLLCPGKAIYPCYRESYQHNQAKVRIRNRVTRGTIASTEHHLTSTNNISWKCFFLLIQCASHSRKIVSMFPKPHKFAVGFHQSGCFYTNPNSLPKIGVNSWKPKQHYQVYILQLTGQQSDASPTAGIVWIMESIHISNTTIWGWQFPPLGSHTCAQKVMVYTLRTTAQMLTHQWFDVAHRHRCTQDITSWSHSSITGLSPCCQ